MNTSLYYGERRQTHVYRCLRVLMSSQRPVHPLVHFEVAVGELTEIHAFSSKFQAVRIRINRVGPLCAVCGVPVPDMLKVKSKSLTVGGPGMAEESKRPRLEAGAERVHFVSPGEVITADTGFMRCR